MPTQFQDDLLRALDLIPRDFPAAHRIAQQYEGEPLADALHAIIHRREGDFSNSLFWWRRVGKKLPAGLAAVYPSGDPAAFVQAATTGSPEELAPVEMAELNALRAEIRAES
jgi:hypothetical protein